MDHLILLIMLLALMIGTWAAVDTLQLFKIHGSPLLRALVRYIVFLNAAVLLYLVTKYLYLNFPDSQFADPKSAFYAVVFFVATPIEIGLAYFYVIVTLGLREADSPRVLNRIFAAGLILVGMSCVIGLTTYMNTGSNTWIMMTYMGVVSAAAIGILTASLRLAWLKSSEKSNRPSRSIRFFGGFHLLGYAVFFGSAALPDSFNLYVATSALLYLNAIPILWLHRFFSLHHAPFSSDENLGFMDALLKQRQISKREREIMELILQGKSNKEIEDSLYISYNTVKNHVYNLYQKLGVKSRGQMIQFVLQARKQIER
jgi:DNA-binding CsgD family transcriptional regulator